MQYSVITEDAATLASSALRETVVLDHGMDPSVVSGPEGQGVTEPSASEAMNPAALEPAAAPARFFRPFEDQDPRPSNGDLNDPTPEASVSSNGHPPSVETSNGHLLLQSPVPEQSSNIAPEPPEVLCSLEVNEASGSANSHPENSQETPQSLTPEVADPDPEPESPESEEKRPGDNENQDQEDEDEDEEGDDDDDDEEDSEEEEEEENLILDTRLRRRKEKNPSKVLQKQQRELIRRISKILRKDTEAITEGESELLSKHPKVVAEAKKRHHNQKKLDERKLEVEDKPEVLAKKCLQLAKAIQVRKFTSF